MLDLYSWLDGNQPISKDGHMRTEQFEGTIESYQGKTLDNPIKFSGNVELYENTPEAKQSEDWPSENEILKVVNTKKLTAAKAAEYQKATAALKKEYEESDEFKRANLVKALMLSGKSKAEAEGIADTILR